MSSFVNPESIIVGVVVGGFAILFVCGLGYYMYQICMYRHYQQQRDEQIAEAPAKKKERALRRAEWLHDHQRPAKMGCEYDVETCHYRWTGSKNSDCPICLCAFECNEDMIVTTNCSHAFHYDCLKDWVAKKDDEECPICRCPMWVPSEQQPMANTTVAASTFDEDEEEERNSETTNNEDDDEEEEEGDENEKEEEEEEDEDEETGERSTTSQQQTKNDYTPGLASSEQ